MPDFEITAPDGKKFVVTAPEGASQDEIMGYVQKMHGGSVSSGSPATNDPATKGGDSNQIAAPDPPSLGQQFTRGLGLGARDAIEGVGQLPGMIYDAAAFPGKMIARGINAVAGTNIPIVPSSSELLPKVGDALGLPTAQTPGERVRSDIGRNVASLIPTMGAGAAMQGGTGIANTIGQALTASPISQFTGAAGSGFAGGVAREADLPPAVQFGAALAGGVTGAAVPTLASMAGRGIASMAQPFSESGRRQIVGEALLRNSSDPETLAQRLTTGADDETRRLPNSPVTSGVAARDPQMLTLESGLRSDAQTQPGVMSPATAIRDVEAQRNANRLATAEALIKGGDDPALRGSTVRDALVAGKSAMGARTNQLYTAVDQEAKFPIKPLADELASLESKYFGPLSGGMPSSLSSVRNDLTAWIKQNTPKPGEQMAVTEQGPLAGIAFEPKPQVAVPPPTADWRTLQSLRRRLGDIAGEAARDGKTTEATVAGNLRSMVDDIGMSGEWGAAGAQRRAVGEALTRDATGANATGRIMARDSFGNPMLADDKVARAAIADPASARQVIGALEKAVKDGNAAGIPDNQLLALNDKLVQTRRAMRDQFADSMLGASRTTSDIADAAGNISRQLSPAQFTRWWEKNRATADVLFTTDQRKTLDRLAADFSETSVVNTARARGSDTAQNLSVGNFIAKLTNGIIDPQNPLAQSLGNLGPIAGWLTRSPEQAMRQMLVQAIRDPHFAAQLVQDAGPQSLQRAMLYFQQTMPERLRDAVIGASAREAPRVGLANPTPDPRRLQGPAGQ